MSCERARCLDGHSPQEGYDNLRNDEALYCKGCVELEEMKRCSFCDRYMHGAALELSDGRRSCVGCMADSDSCGDLQACFGDTRPSLEVRYPGETEWKRCESVEEWSDFVGKMYGRETEWVAYLDAASRRAGAEALQAVREAMGAALDRERAREQARLREDKRVRRRELRVQLLRRAATLMLRVSAEELDASVPCGVLQVQSSRDEALATTMLASETLREGAAGDFAVLRDFFHQFQAFGSLSDF